MTGKSRNENGLTFAEWCDQANCSRGALAKRFSCAESAWDTNMDPNDFRADRDEHLRDLHEQHQVDLKRDGED